MSSDKLSAYFPGLVDICIDDDGQFQFLTVKDWDVNLTDKFETSEGVVVPPKAEHLPFTLPRASEVMKYVYTDDENLYTDILAYLKRFSESPLVF